MQAGKRNCLRTLAALWLALAGACGGADPPPRGEERGGEAPAERAPGPAAAPPASDPGRAVAYLRDASLRVRFANGDDRALVPVQKTDRGEAAGVEAFAWLSPTALVYSAGMELWRIGVDGAGDPEPIAILPDAANTRVAELVLAIGRPTLLALTAGPEGIGQYDHSRFFAVELGQGPAGAKVEEIDSETYRTRAGIPRPPEPGRSPPLVSPSGRWSLRVEGGAAGPGDPAEVPERLMIEGSDGTARVLVDAAKLPLEEGAPPYTGFFNDVAWAPGTDTVLFVAQRECGDFCYGPLFAIEADGSGLRQLASSVSVVPREWNGTRLLLDDFPADRQVVVVVDLVSGARAEVGEGSDPKWQPAGDFGF